MIRKSRNFWRKMTKQRTRKLPIDDNRKVMRKLIPDQGEVAQETDPRDVKSHRARINGQHVALEAEVQRSMTDRTIVHRHQSSSSHRRVQLKMKEIATDVDLMTPTVENNEVARSKSTEIAQHLLRKSWCANRRLLNAICVAIAQSVNRLRSGDHRLISVEWDHLRL